MISRKIIIIVSVVCLLSILGVVSFALRQESHLSEKSCEPNGQGAVEVYFFYSDSCSVCAKTNIFLRDFQASYPQQVAVKKCSISEESAVEKLIEFYQEHKVPRESFGTVPAVFVGERNFIGFSDRVGQEIKTYVLQLAEEASTGIAVEQPQEEPQPKTVNIPILGEIEVAKYSLPAMAVVLGFFDGFNVCSLGALVLILGLVLVLKSRKRILIFGSIFILTTAIVYGLLIVLWYHIFALLTPYLKIMEILVGLLGMVGGIYFLKEFIKFKKQGPTCELQTGKGLMARFSEKMKTALQGQRSIVAIVVAILLFAAVITAAEFPCSAAVPLFFASTLADAQLPALSYLLYIALFILFYMIDEVVVFIIAVLTMTVRIASKRVVVWITLIEAIVLFLLGLYYLFGFLLF